MGKEDKSEYARVRMSVQLETCGATVQGDMPNAQDTIIATEYSRIWFGNAMNGYELRESLPEFLIDRCLEVLEVACGHSRELARELLAPLLDHRA